VPSPAQQASSPFASEAMQSPTKPAPRLQTGPPVRELPPLATGSHLTLQVAATITPHERAYLQTRISGKLVQEFRVGVTRRLKTSIPSSSYICLMVETTCGPGVSKMREEKART